MSFFTVIEESLATAAAILRAALRVCEIVVTEYTASCARCCRRIPYGRCL